jgi:hypothetical protein
MKEHAVVSTLALVLTAASGMNALAQDRPQPTASCVAGPTTLCLNDQRFMLDVQWKDFEGKTGAGQAVSLSSDTGYFWFFNSSNVELVVKVLDGRGLNGHFWVFFGALSNVEYTLRVTDSLTGSVKTYFNPSHQFASVGDTDAFSASGTVSAAHPIVETNETQGTPSPTKATAQALPTCESTETSLCLNDGRFRVEVTWKDFQGVTGQGKAISLTSDTGYFWFFNSANVELVVKVLDGRTLNNRFWVFYGALSNVEYEMTVTDTLTGNVSTYVNPSGRFASAGDTGAFPAGHSVAVRLDQSRAVSADIPTTGGTVSATASDGTVFTLTIPPDALLSDETITMTPVTAVDGLPLSGGLAGAVDLAPTGLRLFQLATLTITPAAAVPLAEEMTFAWRGNGEEFFLYPPELGTSAISMKLMHFSGYGVGRGSAADEAAQQQRVPASPEDALSQQLQELIAQRRRTQSKGLDPLADPVWNLLLQYHAHLMFDLEFAKKSCPAADVIVPRAVAWSNEAKFWRCCEGEIQAVRDAIIEALVNCYNESFDKCVSLKDPEQTKEMLAALKQLQSYGADGRVDQNKIERCVRFELKFDSTIHIDVAPGRFYQQVIAPGVPIRLSPDRYLTGSGALHTVKVEYVAYEGCPATATGGTGAFDVVKLGINLNLYEGTARPREPVTMKYTPGHELNTVTVIKTADCHPYTATDPGWWSVYWAFHFEEQTGDLLKATGWQRVGGDIYARKSYQDRYETTSMILKHTPE